VTFNSPIKAHLLDKQGIKVDYFAAVNELFDLDS
jgi:hypothetical protein